MFCHQEEEQSLFVCQSSFVPQAQPGPGPEQPEQPKKPKYLPGERLLIQLGRERKKTKKKVDVDRIAESVSRVLNGVF